MRRRTSDWILTNHGRKGVERGIRTVGAARPSYHSTKHMIGGDSSIRNVSVGLWCINEPNFCEACEASWSIGGTRVEDARRPQLWALWTSSADLAACLAACCYQFGLVKLEPIFGEAVEVALHSRGNDAIDERGQRLTHGKHWCVCDITLCPSTSRNGGSCRRWPWPTVLIIVPLLPSFSSRRLSLSPGSLCSPCSRPLHSFHDS